MDEAFKKELESEGYYSLKEIPGRGICGLSNMLFTCALCYNLQEDCTYEGRYCFPSIVAAAISLATWDGTGDPDGPWRKHKGFTEYSNPNEFQNRTKHSETSGNNL